MAFTVSDGFLIAATLLGPVLAIQVQKIIERSQETNQRRDRIFKILMTTRATRLAPDHIQALNMINIEFPDKRKFKKVRSAWKAYFTHLSEDPPEDPQERAVYFGRRPDLFTDVLYEMGSSLNYDFDKTEISKEAYWTKYHVEMENDQNIIRKKLVEILQGSASIPMSVVGFPVNEEFASDQAEYFKLTLDKLKADKPLKVEITESDPLG